MRMVVCSMPQCQTTAGCKCTPVGVIIPPITTDHAWKAAYELSKAESARLTAVIADAQRVVNEALREYGPAVTQTTLTPERRHEHIEACRGHLLFLRAALAGALG